MSNLMVIVVLSFVVAFTTSTTTHAHLQLGFYDHSCPKAEKLIMEFVQEHIPNAPSLAASLLRMHFHDCFVRGCDASVLLNFTSTNAANETEKVSLPNQAVRGFDFIDRVKSLVEAECPGVVSCADIVTLVARDSLVVTGGPFWNVPTGRRDGSVSNSSEALSQIPPPTSSFDNLTGLFAAKGLNTTDLVILSGAHTIGIARCVAFSNRLYNFTGAGDEDPSLDSEYAENLRQFKCKVPDSTTFVEMDPGSVRTFDLSYYRLVLKRRGLLTSDAALTTDSAARDLITSLVNGSPLNFFRAFALAMEKMGRIDVKTGTEGEIRKQCGLVNT